MSRMRPSVRSWWFASLLLVWLALAPMAAAQRVVAVADVHGDYESFVSILQAAKLTDAQNRWIGGNSIFVQTGDFTDRGPRSREVMDLMMALETEAPKQGGKVIILLGNHEVMNMFGELAYVSEGEYAAFADENSEKRREKAFKEYGKWLRKAMTSSDRLPEFTLETEGQWKKRRPLGFVEHREAFGPQGKYGKWLRSLDAVAKVGDTLFLHGGISPRLHNTSVEQINKKVHSEIQTFDLVMKDLSYSGLSLPSLFLKELLPVARQEAIETGRPGSLREVAGMDGWWTMSSEGPLWFRGYNTWTEEEGPEYLAKILKSFGVARVVVGHTPQTEGRIRARFDGKVYLIDTGMLQTHYTGQASALEIADADITGIYMDRRVVLNGTKPAVVVPATFQREDKERSARGGGIGSEAAVQDAPAAAPAAQGAPAAAPESIWTDVTGNPLPFKTDEELIDFLVNAKVVSSKTLGKGITAPKKVVLELNGVRAHGVFRDVDEDGPTTMASGIRDAFFRDSYMFEPAAYQLSLLLGTRNVPPAAERKVNGKKGSIQIYIENGMDEQDRIKKKMNPPNPIRYSRQVHMMRVFDNLVYNDDRNQGNIYYDLNWNLWLIDHTRAFRRKTDLKEPHMVMACDRALFEKLKTLDETATREKLKGLLRGPEIDAILKRRVKLVERIEKLIAERGEGSVLFNLDEAPAPAATATPQ